MLGAPGLMSSLGLRVCRYLRVPGAVEAGWLAGLADRLAWPASSVTVSVIVLGLTGWLVTCFFGCSRAGDILSYAICVSPAPRMQILSLCWVLRGS